MMINKEDMTTKELIYYYCLFGLMFVRLWQGKDPVKANMIESDNKRIVDYLNKKGYKGRWSIAHKTNELNKIEV